MSEEKQTPEQALTPEEAQAPELAEPAETAEPAEATETAETLQPDPETEETQAGAEEAGPEGPQDTEQDTAAPAQDTAEAAAGDGTEEEKAAKPKTPRKRRHRGGRNHRSKQARAAAPDPALEEAAKQQRVADMTRTVQVSIEQLMARLDEEAAAAQQADEDADDEASPGVLPDMSQEEMPAPEEPEEEAETLPQRIGAGVAGGVLRIGRWLLLVLFFVAVIAGIGIGWLYRGATPDMIPQLKVTLDGQPVEPTSYSWKVPVVNELLTRQYDETLSETPLPLEAPLRSADPLFEVSLEGYDSDLTIWDGDDEELFHGTLNDYANSFRYTANGQYRAELVLSSQAERFEGIAHVDGSQTYAFSYEVSIQPVVRLDTTETMQGSVVAVKVTGIPEDDYPTLECELENCGFVPGANDWVAYLPIPYDLAPGEYDIHVRTEGYDQSEKLTVRARDWQYKDYSSTAKLTWPYLSLDDTPPEVKEALEICDQQVYWTATGFVQPFIRSVDITLPFGTTEYVGRTTEQKVMGAGAGRTSTNAVIAGRWGETLIAPADGRVVLAADLGEPAGKTLVIEHGGGLKTVFYDLLTLEVEEGSFVMQRQAVATTQNALIAEARIGQVPVEPLTIWRGQCNAVKVF